MSTIHFHETTTATPEQFVAGLIDFGPGRSELFGNSADGYLKVHDQSPGHADVTEGSRGIWERLDYDWSDPGRVVMTTTDSNVWGRHSGHTYTFTRKPDGTMDVDAVVVREGKNVKGRMLELVIGTVGKRTLGKEFRKTVKAIEARNGTRVPDGAGRVFPASLFAAFVPPQMTRGWRDRGRARSSRRTARAG
jgi:hypothetical protein